MTPIQLLALARALKEKEEKAARNSVAPGSYRVDFNIHISGEVDVEEDYVKTPTVSIPWTEVYALLREILLQGIDGLVARVDRGETLSREDLEGFRRACGLGEDILVETIQRAFDLKNNAEGEGEVIARIPEIKEAQERALDAISRRLGKTPSKGRVKTDLKVEEVTTPVFSLGQDGLSEVFPPSFPKKPA